MAGHHDVTYERQDIASRLEHLKLGALDVYLEQVDVGDTDPVNDAARVSAGTGTLPVSSTVSLFEIWASPLSSIRTLPGAPVTAHCKAVTLANWFSSMTR
jgi:hypothetical protein